MIRSLLNNNILRAYGTSLLGVASGLLTNLWLLRAITRTVSVHDFGIYAFVLQISGYLAVFQLGLDFAASRHIAEALGRKDSDEASRAFYDLQRFNRKVLALGIVAVLIISAAFWYGVGFKENAAARLAGTIALLAGTAQLITFLTRPYSAALIGSQFQATVNIVTALRTVFTTVLAFCLLKSGFYILCVPVAEVMCQLINWQVLRRAANRKCWWKQASPEVENKKSMLASMIKFGGLTSLGGIAWTIESGMDVVILGILTDTKMVAAYVLWWRFPQMLFDLCSRLAFSAFPTFSHRFGVSAEATRLLFGKVAYISLGLGTLACVGISFWLAPFVQLWIGINYTGQQSAYLPIAMGILVCLRTVGNLLGMFWLASGRAELTTALGWIQALFKLLLALWLIPRFGILGVVLASIGSSVLQVAVMSWYLFRERLLMLKVMSATCLLGGLALVASVAGKQCNFSVGWAGLLGGAVATILSWSVIWLVVAWTGELRTNMESILAGLAKRLGMTKAV